MPTIQVLPEDLASQVAAGEVVERPAAAIKELIENSLDAEARNLLIEIEGGGASLLRVSDDGYGMEREDALLSIKRHATSKLKTREDLDRITTLGFRGEAIPSIASISKFRLMTRRHDADSGVEIRIDGGKYREARDYGGPPGTVIEAANLFFCVPGRRKFLRTESTEAGHVEEQVKLHAIASFDVGFTLQKNRREIFRLPPTSGLRERLHDLAGGALATSLIEVPPCEYRGVTVSGLVGPPAMARRDRRFCLAYLNGRPIDTKHIAFALREAYGPGIERGRSPVALVFLEMDPSLADINVHPAKREVRFHKNQTVQEAVSMAIEAALTGAAKVTLQGLGSPPSQATESPQPNETAVTGQPPASVIKPIAPVLPESLSTARGSFQPHLPRQLSSPPPSPSASASMAGPAQLPVQGNRLENNFNIHGVLQNGVAILEGDEGLVLLELRAAHERILYEEMMSQEGDPDPGCVQILLVPAVIDLGAKNFGVLLEHRDRLAELGFGIEQFGSQTIRLTSLPGFLEDEAPDEQLLAILEDIEEGARGKGGWEAVVARRASRQAIPTDRIMEHSAVADLVESLLGCEMPYCAPDGRPTMVQFSYQELDRRFGRNR